MKKPELLFMDVDGTLTDGKIYIGAEGEVAKAFDIKDGYGISVLLPRHGIIPVIITSRSSKIVEHRATELGITEIYQGKSDKIETLLTVAEKYNSSLKDVAYIGDDVQDLPGMKLCGYRGCPSDAVEEVRSAVNYICTRPGGSGAVREFIEWIINKE